MMTQLAHAVFALATRPSTTPASTTSHTSASLTTSEHHALQQLAATQPHALQAQWNLMETGQWWPTVQTQPEF